MSFDWGEIQPSLRPAPTFPGQSGPGPLCGRPMGTCTAGGNEVGEGCSATWRARLRNRKWGSGLEKTCLSDYA